MKAKTGTGKTLGFLIPSVEVLLRRPPLVDAIQCLIMSPTRELALQIANEAESLLTFNQKVKKVVTVVGGTNINSDKKHLSGKVDFLVATPGNSSGVYICNSIVNYLRHGNFHVYRASHRPPGELRGLLREASQPASVDLRRGGSALGHGVSPGN